MKSEEKSKAKSRAMNPGTRGPKAGKNQAQGKNTAENRGQEKNAAKNPAKRRSGGPPLAGIWALGLLLLAACGGKSEGAKEKPGARSASSQPSKKQQKVQHWTCSMHPQVDEDGPGKCPYCGMDLIPMTGGGGGGVLTLTKEAAALAQVKTEEVRRRPLLASVELTGKIVEDETRVHSVTAWVAGRIDRLYVDFTGTRVSVGDHVAELYSPEMISAQEEYLEARQALEEMKASQSPQMLKTSQASVQAARDKLLLLGLDENQLQEVERTGKAKDHITIRAPHGGIVTKKNVRLGMYVKTGQELFEVVDLDQVWVELLAFESELPLLRFGQKVQVLVDALPGTFFEGRISLLDPEIDPRTRTLPLRVVLENKNQRMRPGMFARATVKVPLDALGNPRTGDFSKMWVCPMHPEVVRKEKGECPKCGMALVRGESLGLVSHGTLQDPIAVPESAVLFTGRRSVVWVHVTGDEPKYIPKEIILGPRGDGYYVVLAGLMEGEHVVTDGAFKLDSEAQIKSRPSAPIPSMMAPQGMESPKEEKKAPKKISIDLSGFSEKNLAKALEIYLEAHQAMAASGWGKARKTLLKGLEDLGAPALMRLKKDLLNDPKTLKRVFQKLGAALFARKAELAGIKKDLVWAFCPMAFDNEGANWIQIGKEINNPYFGKAMLRCGEVVEVLKPSKQGVQPLKQTREKAAKKARSKPGPRSKPSSRPASKQPTSKQPTSKQPAPKQPATRQPASKKSAPKKKVVKVDAAQTEPKVGSQPKTPSQPKGLNPLDILADYLQIQKALSEDRIQDAAKGLMALSKRDKKGLLGGIAPGKGAEAVRRAFERLGKYLLKNKAALRGKKQGLVVAHCPMAFGRGADWLQLGKKIRNPYYGSSMLGCGSVVEDLARPAAKKGGKK